MRLAFVCTQMLPVPAIRGGAIQILIDGISPYISRSHDLTVFSITDPDLPAEEERQGIKYVRFPQQTYPQQVAEYLRQHPPFDVVHVFNRPRNVCEYGEAAPTTRFVVSLHNEMFHPQKLSDQGGVACINRVDAIIAISNFIGSTVYRRFPFAKKKVKTVYSGVDIHRYIPIYSRRRRRSVLRRQFEVENKKVILFVGRLSIKKGPHLLIKAMELLVEKHPDAILFIVGSRWFSDNTVNPYVDELMKLSVPIKDHVWFTGHVSPKDIPDYYLMGDVFVCSSQWQEPLARVHYEAMAAGLPIITTDRGGNAEVITHMSTGLVLDDYDNPVAFAEAIDLLLSNPKLRRDLGRNARIHAERYFNFQRVAKDLEQIYLEAHLKQNSL